MNSGKASGARYHSRLSRRLLPVSYTHLDVYKRQAGGLAALGVCIWFLVRSMSGSYQKALLQFCAGTGDKDMADVYKRQLVDDL